MNGGQSREQLNMGRVGRKRPLADDADAAGEDGSDSSWHSDGEKASESDSDEEWGSTNVQVKREPTANTSEHQATQACTKCRRKFQNKRQRIEHEATHEEQDGVEYACGTCAESFATVFDRESHQQKAHAIICSHTGCEQTFTSVPHLTLHTQRYHQPASDGQLFLCEPCNLSFPTRFDLRQHQDATHLTFACAFEGCDKRYSKREHATRHFNSVHETKTDKSFRCEICQIYFAYKHGLVRHQHRAHANENKPYACSTCLVAFKKKSELQAHSYVHTGVLPFACDDCSQRFLKRFQLTRHSRTHSANRTAQTQVFVCDQPDCDEILFSTEELETHVKTAHGGPADQGKGKERQSVVLLVCKVCDRTFDRNQNLRAHLRTHFEDVDERKMHTCPMAGCDKAYTRKSNLMAHYNAVHDELKSQRFVCPYEGCDGRFGYKKVLATHLERVHEHPVAPKARKLKSMGVMLRVLGEQTVDATMEVKEESNVAPVADPSAVSSSLEPPPPEREAAS